MMEATKGVAKSEDVDAAGLKDLKIGEEEDDGGDDVTCKDECADLFGPPPSRPDCPICFLPLPIDTSESTYMDCCGKIICTGCNFENIRVIDTTNAKNARQDARNRDEGRPPLQHMCAFCRAPTPTTNEEVITRLQERMELNDADAFDEMAGLCYKNGECGLKKDERKAFELHLHAAELGHAGACCNVAHCYYQIVDKDETKCRVYLETGAKKGDTVARHNLGVLEYKNGNVDLAVRHVLISACAGDQDSLDVVKEQYEEGNVSKDDFARALRCSHAARKEEWSKEREAAKREG